MTAEQKELFSKYSDCVREFQSLVEYLLFQNSLKLGARMDGGDYGGITYHIRAGLSLRSPALYVESSLFSRLIVYSQNVRNLLGSRAKLGYSPSSARKTFCPPGN